MTYNSPQELLDAKLKCIADLTSRKFDIIDLIQPMTTKQRIAKLRQHSKTVDIMTSNKRKASTLVPITPVLKASIKYEKQLTELKDLLSWAETPVAGWLAFCGHTYTAAARKDYKKMQARIKRALK